MQSPCSLNFFATYINQKPFLLQQHVPSSFQKGPLIKDVINQGGGGFDKRWSFLIGLFSKSDDEGGMGGVKNLKKMMTSFMNSP